MRSARERRFALADSFSFPTWARLQSVFRSETHRVSNLLDLMVDSCK